ncbi:MAG: hypothetical protein IJ509_01530 [Bacilli bacterium]|nr:hypothetical protein [Bacilli bacterium]
MHRLKVMLKSKKKILIVIGSVLILCLVIIFIFLNDRSNFFGVNDNDARKFKEEYENLNDQINEDGKKYPEVHLGTNNIIEYVTVEEVVELFEENKDMVIYFGEATCLYCRTAVKILCDVAETTDLSVIYYLPIAENNNYDEILKYLKEELIKENEGKKEISIPLVIFSVNGDVVSYWEGTLFSQKTPYDELDESQIQGLSEIYKYGINDVLQGLKAKDIIT